MLFDSILSRKYFLLHVNMISCRQMLDFLHGLRYIDTIYAQDIKAIIAKLTILRGQYEGLRNSPGKR